MRILTKAQFKNLMDEYFDGGIVFAEYTPDILASGLMVTCADFGATDVIPYRGEVFCWDWSIDDFLDDQLFAVYDNNDVLQMIQTLTNGLRVDLDYINEFYVE